MKNTVFKNNRVDVFMLRVSTMLTLVFIITCQVFGAQYVEDFTDDMNPSAPGFASEVFQYTILPPEGGSPGDENWAFGTYNNFYLYLAPAICEVTFTLGPGEYVDYVSIRMDATGSSSTITFEAIGTLGTYTVTNPCSYLDPAEPVEYWPLVDTAGSDIGEITKIRVISDEGKFDNLTINTIPEPATAILFALGGILLRRRK